MAEPLNIQPTRLGDRLEKMDADIKKWGLITKDRLIRSIFKAGLDAQIKLRRATSSRIVFRKNKDGKFQAQRQQPLARSLHVKLKKKDMELDQIGVSFAQHGIFVERGVGKYRPIGSAAAARAADPWLSSVLDARLNILADLLSENYADIVAEEIKINIPGILKTNIKIA